MVIKVIKIFLYIKIFFMIYNILQWAEISIGSLTYI